MPDGRFPSRFFLRDVDAFLPFERGGGVFSSLHKSFREDTFPYDAKRRGIRRIIVPASTSMPARCRARVCPRSRGCSSHRDAVRRRRQSRQSRRRSRGCARARRLETTQKRSPHSERRLVKAINPLRAAASLVAMMSACIPRQSTSGNQFWGSSSSSAFLLFSGDDIDCRRRSREGQRDFQTKILIRRLLSFKRVKGRILCEAISNCPLNL